MFLSTKKNMNFSHYYTPYINYCMSVLATIVTWDLYKSSYFISIIQIYDKDFKQFDEL